jgi:hypothetical protein
MSSYQPLLPKTSGEFKGGDAAGIWIEEKVKLFNDLGDSLEFDAGSYGEVNSIPSPWSRPLQLISAFRNTNYPNRDWLIAQYRGLLTTLALAENLKLKINATQVRLEEFQNNEFAKCVWKLRPNDIDSILQMNPPKGPWSELHLFELDGVVIGMTSPATLVCPTGYLPNRLKNSIAWLEWKKFALKKKTHELGFFVDPLHNGLASNHKDILSPWLSNLKTQMIDNQPLNTALAGAVAGVLEKYISELNVTERNIYKPATNSSPFGISLGYKPLDSLYPAAAISAASHVEVIPAEGKTPGQKLYIIDPLQLPGILGVPLQEINVVDSSSLLNFDPSQHDQSKARFATPQDFFISEIFYSPFAGLLPGSWLDQKTRKLDNLTILLPFQPFIQEYFTSDYLEKNLTVERDSQGSNPSVKISLTVYLSGVNEKKPYIVSQSFILKNENDLGKDYPTVALWPNLPPIFNQVWREYFLLESVLDIAGNRYAFQIQKPNSEARCTTRDFGQEKYLYWQCTQRPDILEALNDDAKYLGMIPLSSSKLNQGVSDNWTVGVDFGTSFTNIYLRKGNNATKRIELNPNLLKVTLGSELSYPEYHDHIYREFFIPDVLVPKDHLPPMSTALITLGWQEKANTIARIVTECRIYNPRSDGEFSDAAKTNIKWENVEYQEPFLAQLVRMISVEAAMENVHTLEWAVSYPSAFSQMDLNDYQDTWARVLAQVSRVSGQNHSLSSKGLQTESVAFAQYFADVLRQPLVHTTCVDVGGGTADLSIWNDHYLVHQASVPYAGRNLFHDLLRDNLDYFDQIFGLNQEQLDKLRIKTKNGESNNFNSIIDIRLRMEEENSDKAEGSYNSLINGYRINKLKERNRQFRSLLAFGYCGLFHYIGLVQKWLKQEGLVTDEYYSSLLLGGNGSRFVHWLSPTGRWQTSSEVNELIEGIMLASSELKRNPDLLTLSNAPKHEACGGLVVPPGGTKLTGIDRKTADNPFLGEHCEINGKAFAAHERLTLNQEWNEITEFVVTSTTELEAYLGNFNRIIKERKIEEIEQLRDYKSGNLLEINDDHRKQIKTNLTKLCLKKKGPKDQFEPDPPFLMALKAFLMVLAKEWSRAKSR